MTNFQAQQTVHRCVQLTARIMVRCIVRQHLLFLIDGTSYLCHHHCQKERKSSKKKTTGTAVSIHRCCVIVGPRCGAMMELMEACFCGFGRYQSRLHACMELCSQYGTRFFFGKTHSVPSLDAVVQLYSWSGPRTTINCPIVR